VLVVLMTIQGLGFLTPVNALVCLELQKTELDLNKIGVWMQRYFYAVALQGMIIQPTGHHWPGCPGCGSCWDRCAMASDGSSTVAMIRVFSMTIVCS
jgi:hypothetical protein